MTMSINKLKLIIYISVLAICFSSCKAIDNANNRQKGAAIGTTSGAILGAIIGNNVGSGNSELGALIGGVVGGGAGVVIGNQMDKQAQRIEEEVPGATVERVDQGIVVTFDENSGVNFATEKYNITSESQETLDKLVAVFEAYPDTNLLVVGHTDNTGNDAYNMTLSKNRAQAVTNYLKNSKGMSASRLTTHWFGEEQPIADNTTAEGRAKNRRVNIAIVPNEEMIDNAQQETAK
ncbi:OmpA family protein [Bizionia sp. KMM 8389]